MDNKKTLITAGIVGVGGVALAYLGHSYLVEKEESKTKMEKAADTVGTGRGFMSFLWGQDSEKSMEHIRSHLRCDVYHLFITKQEFTKRMNNPSNRGVIMNDYKN